MKDQEFLKKLKLEISMDGKKLYTGDILAASLNKAVSLGKFDSGKSGQMNFQITVPAELDNTYALREGDVKWIFSVEDDQQKQLTETPGLRRPGGSGTPGKETGRIYNNETANSTGKTKPVKTGDDTEIWLFLFMGGAALLAGVLAIRKGGKRT